MDISSWKEFKVSDLFGNAKLGKYHNPKELHEDRAGYEYICASNFNNGVNAVMPKVNGEVLSLTDAHIIAWGKQCPCFSYHANACVTSQGMYYYPVGDISEMSALFLCSCFQSLCNSKGYGYADCLIGAVMDEEVIKLPTTPDGQPDWDYMESYMKAVMEESEKSLENLKRTNDTKHLIDVSGWGEFRVGDLFDKLTLKCRKSDFNKAVDCSEIQTEEFSLPLTNAKHFNNGIQFYGRPDEWDSAEMTIDIVSNGAIATGDVYAQPQKTGVLWDSYLVKCKYDIESEFVLQYMACVIQRCIKQYFGWDDKCTWDKVKEQMLRLPIDANGEPDWQYMEDYMKRRLNEAELAVSQLQSAV